VCLSSLLFWKLKAHALPVYTARPTMLSSPRDTSTSHKTTNMHRYSILSRILLILSATNLALAAPVLVQEKRPACVDVVHVPKDVITVLGKRMDEFRGWLDIARLLVHPLEESGSESGSDFGSEFSSEFSSEHGSMESHTSDPGRESMDVEPDALPPNPEWSTETEPEHLHTPQSSQDWSTEPEHLTPPSSPDWSTEAENWHTPPSSLASSTESDSDRWSTISNAPSTESKFENLQAVNNELKGKVKVERHISGTTRVL